MTVTSPDGPLDWYPVHDVAWCQVPAVKMSIRITGSGLRPIGGHQAYYRDYTVTCDSQANAGLLDMRTRGHRSRRETTAAGKTTVAAATTDAETAVTTLFRQHRLGLLRLALLLVDDQQSDEDVVQDAFLGLYRRWPQLQETTNAQAYLRSAVLNNSRSVLRRRRTARAYVPPHAPDAASAESQAMLSAEHAEVLGCLATLTSRQRQVLVLRYYEDLSEAQIAQATGLSQGAVKSTASRALDALERRWDADRASHR